MFTGPAARPGLLFGVQDFERSAAEQDPAEQSRFLFYAP